MLNNARTKASSLLEQIKAFSGDKINTYRQKESNVMIRIKPTILKTSLLALSLCAGLFALPGCSGGQVSYGNTPDTDKLAEVSPSPAPSQSSESTPEPVAEASPEPTREVFTIHGKKYYMTFFDDFDGDKLDRRKWEHCPEWERQDLKIPWKKEAAYLDGNGNLVISVMEDEKTGYKTGAVRTKGHFSQAYGYFEIRAKLQQSEGFWTAFWLMGPSQGNIGNGSADGAEIDIFEALYKERPRIHHAIHWDGYGEEHKSVGKSTFCDDDIYDGYHTFALEWNKEAYIFYIDDEEVWRTTADGICDQRLYMKVTAEVGTWGGDMKKAKLPDYMLVDYVKAYQFVED